MGYGLIIGPLWLEDISSDQITNIIPTLLCCVGFSSFKINKFYFKDNESGAVKRFRPREQDLSLNPGKREKVSLADWSGWTTMITINIYLFIININNYSLVYFLYV